LAINERTSLWLLRTPVSTRLQDAILGLPFIIVVAVWIATYASVGFLFFFIYQIDLTELLIAGRPTTWQDALSFSFVTQATIGYGDVTPSGWWRLAANLQAIVGTGLNGAAIGLLTFRILRRGVPIRATDAISFREVGDEKFSFWIRYISVDTRDLVEVTASVFFITDGVGVNPRYDTLGGPAYEMKLVTVPPMTIMALDVPATIGRLDFRSSESDAVYNDRTIPVGPGAFFDNDQVDSDARLLLRIRGFHSSTGELISFVREYYATDIKCQCFDGINNNTLRFATLRMRRKAAAEKFNRFSDEERAHCAACACLPSCPFGAADLKYRNVERHETIQSYAP
jgi:hypothetical protein